MVVTVNLWITALCALVRYQEENYILSEYGILLISVDVNI